LLSKKRKYLAYYSGIQLLFRTIGAEFYKIMIRKKNNGKGMMWVVKSEIQWGARRFNQQKKISWLFKIQRKKLWQKLKLSFYFPKFPKSGELIYIYRVSPGSGRFFSCAGLLSCPDRSSYRVFCIAYIRLF